MRLLLLLSFIACLPAFAKEKPNILFIFADDMTYAAVGALEHPEVKTPNLDKLFKSGTTFTHAYNPGAWNGAVCIASRTMLMSGRHVWHAHREEKQLNEMTLWPQLMSQAGYETYFTGKWHVKAQARKIFDHVGHIRPGMPRDTKHGYNRPRHGHEDTWDPADPKNGGFWKGGKHWSEVEADTAVKFLGQAKENQEKPFFFYLAFNAPHDPRQAPQDYLDLYPAEKMSIPDNYLPYYPHRKIMESAHDVRDEFLAPMPRTQHSIQVNRREYFALISHLDTQIGRVLDALDSNGQRENTVIIFTADHGLAVGRHGLLGKQNPYDHSVRVPYVISGPNISAGKKIQSPIYLQDSLPTTLEIAGSSVPEAVQFQSFLPVMKDEAKGREAIYFGYRESQRSLTKDGYKLIVYPKGKIFRLYHISEDPLELNDLLEKGRGRNIAQKMLADLKAEAKRHGDELTYPEFHQ